MRRKGIVSALFAVVHRRRCRGCGSRASLYQVPRRLGEQSHGHLDARPQAWQCLRCRANARLRPVHNPLVTTVVRAAIDSAIVHLSFGCCAVVSTMVSSGPGLRYCEERTGSVCGWSLTSAPLLCRAPAVSPRGFPACALTKLCAGIYALRGRSVWAIACRIPTVLRASVRSGVPCGIPW